MTCHIGGLFLGTSSLGLGRTVAPLAVPLCRHIPSDRPSEGYPTAATMYIPPGLGAVSILLCTLLAGGVSVLRIYVRGILGRRTACDWIGNKAAGLIDQ